MVAGKSDVGHFPSVGPMSRGNWKVSALLYKQTLPSVNNTRAVEMEVVVLPATAHTSVHSAICYSLPIPR